MAEIKIKVNENGPILVPGTVTYVDDEGNEQTTQGTMVALCRCGHSANKPFCDGAHNKAGFQAKVVELTLKE